MPNAAGIAAADVASLAEGRAADLLLAAACATGDPAAIALFRDRYTGVDCA